jgi:hypothetical protein
MLTPLLLALAIIAALWFELAGRKHGIAAIPSVPALRRLIVRAVLEPCARTPASSADPSAPIIIDLGCGWGGLLAAINRHLPHACLIGYELFPPAWAVARLRFWRQHNVTIERRDLFTAPLHQADIVVCYLSHDLMRRLEPVITAAARPGTTLISASFPLPTRVPSETRQARAWGVSLTLYLYRF